jgi:hypothetical protein
MAVVGGFGGVWSTLSRTQPKQWSFGSTAAGYDEFGGYKCWYLGMFLAAPLTTA